MIRFDIITIFPQQIENFLAEGVFRIAQKKKLAQIFVHNLRDWTDDNHKTVDDRPFGGGAGMVLRVEPIDKAVTAVKKKARGYKSIVLMTSPAGKKMDQEMLKSYASRLDESDGIKKLQIIILCGHYEGFDERVRDLLIDEEISLGDFVLSGGEIPALAFIDGIIRLIPGVLGNEMSPKDESFEDGLLEYPQYTRPAEYKGLKVPDVLLTGNHKNIEDWRKEKSQEMTKSRRKDLLKN